MADVRSVLGRCAAAAEQQTVAESIMRIEHCLIIGQVDQERNAAAGFNCLQVRSSDAADRRCTLPLEQSADDADGWAFLLSHSCSLSSIVWAAARVECDFSACIWRAEQVCAARRPSIPGNESIPCFLDPGCSCYR